jgi:prepilin-type processing-associated H-X9-DG protein
MMYIQDYDETYPRANNYPATPSEHYQSGYWYNLLRPYIKSGTVGTAAVVGRRGEKLLVCPTDADAQNQYSGGYGWNYVGTARSNVGGRWIGNGFGYWFAQACTPSGDNVRLAQVTEPANTILATDPARNGYFGNGLYADGAADISFIPTLHGGKVGPFSGGGWSNLPEPADKAGGNYIFADGHVKWIHTTRSWRSAMWNVDKSVTRGVLRD